MDRFFVKIFIRNLSRKGLFPIINIAGLSIGLAAVLLICAFIFNEYSFDKSFTHHQRIYRANSESLMPGMAGIMTISVSALASSAKEEIPGVEAAVRVNVHRQVSVKTGNVPFIVDKLCWADEDFFLLFNTPFIYGSAEEIFAQPSMIALSESQSKIFFGDKNPIGEILMLYNEFPMEVRAVYRDFPENSSLHDNQIVGSLMSSRITWSQRPDWNNPAPETYFLLASGTDATVVEAGMQRLVEKNVENPSDRIRLQALGKIHLYSKDLTNYGNLTGNHGDIGQIKMFSLLAAVILLVACINYMNLSTARAQKRSKEIGISKTVGAKRREIIWRLYAETGMFTCLSFAVAVVLALMTLPVLNYVLGQNIPPEIFLNAKFLLGLLSIYLLTTFIAASYPALYLSGFPAITVIRQSVFTKGSRHSFVRKGLNIVQFSVAMILIAWVMVIQTQMNFVNHKDKGYNVHLVVGIPLPDQSGLDALKNDYAAQESVSAVAFASGFPVSESGSRALYKTMTHMREFMSKSGDHPVSPVLMQWTKVTPEAIDLLQLKLIAGTTLPESRPDDTITSIVINRKTVEFMETSPEEIIGTRLPVGMGRNVYVCGVVEDFHFQSLHETVTSHGLQNSNNEKFTHLLLRMKEGNLSQQLLTYEEIFKKHYPNDLFEVQFPDLIMTKAYEGDRQTGVIVFSFSILAIWVACLGVFGLSAFMAEQRTKGIGIRKVLGARAFNIVRLFTDNYLRLLALSLVIALPIAWWIGGKYLENFAYRISLSWWMFAAAALITVVLTLVTVGWQAIKAATENPVKAIKSE